MADNRMGKFSFFKSVLARKFILSMLLFSALTTVLGTSLRLYIDYRHDLEHLDYLINQIERSQLPSVVKSIWVADRELIDIKLAEILSLPNIQYLAIRRDGELVASAGEQKSENIITRQFPLRHLFRGQEVDLGYLYVEASLDSIDHKLRQTGLLTLLISGVEIFLFALFMLLLFYFIIGRDLKVLADYTASLNLGSLDIPLRLQRSGGRHRYDELDSVASSINGMRATLLREVNNLKEAEEKIAKGKSEFAAIFNSIMDALVFVDLQRRIVMTNPAFTKTFGYELDELTGQSAELLYTRPETYRKQGRKKYNAAAAGSGTIYENEYRRKDGTVFTGETLGAKVWDEKGEVIGFLAIIRDITEKQQFLAEKAKLETSLRQAYKMEALGTMAGGIAHDFNNILAIILGNVDFALEDIPVGHPSRDSLDQALDAANRAKDLVRQILAFSRQDKPQKTPLKPALLVKETLKLLRSTTPATISIVEHVDNGCGAIMADPTQFHQLVMNLFSNAVQAMDEKGPIAVDLREIELGKEDFRPDEKIRPGRYVRLSVTDSGTGMDRATMERIFDPFFTTKEIGKGTGMGLAVVHGVVESSDGIVRVTSEPGRGSTFAVYFPLVGHKQIAGASPQETAAIPTGSERVLFVDDEEGLALMGKRILEKLGYRVTCSTSSVAALANFRSAPASFDLLITDQSMPDLSGLELIAEITKIRAGFPVILCTGYSNKVSAKNVAELGVRALLMKPYEKKKLAEMIRKVLD